jgi:hypothetical protein
MLTLFLGLIGHLKSHFPPLHQLFLYMKLRTEHPPTSEEIQFASGQKSFDPSIHAEYLQKLDVQTSGIKEVFVKQKAKAAVRTSLSNVAFIF